MKNETVDFSRLTKTTNFYLIRHGESQANDGGIIGGGKHHDPDLTEKGEIQASYLGAFFKDRKINIDLIYSSTLTRAKKTARILANGVDYSGDIIESDDLIEIETGSFTDHTYEEVSQKFPEVWEDFKYRLWDAVPGAETSNQIKDRVSKIFNSAIEHAENENKRNIAIVCHWGVLQWLHNIIFRTEQWKPLIHIPNCGISHFFITGFEKEFRSVENLNNRDIKGHRYEMWGYIAKTPYPDSHGSKGFY